MSGNPIKWNAVIFSLILMAVYGIYGTGTYLSTGVWPDGVLIMTVMGVIVFAFGYTGGWFHGRGTQ